MSINGFLLSIITAIILAIISIGYYRYQYGNFKFSEKDIIRIVLFVVIGNFVVTFVKNILFY